MKKPLLVAVSALVLSLSVANVAIQPVQAAEVKVYSVTGVTLGQFLNMRSAPGTSSSIVTKIPADSTGVVATGEEKKLGAVTWAKVYWAGKGGWVSKVYLKSGLNMSGGSTGTPPRPTTNGVVMRCTGTEPFWGITITEREMKVDIADGANYSVPVTFRQTSANNQTIAVIAGANGANTTQTFLQKVASCSDGMSDIKYPYAVAAVVNNRNVYSGCCGVQR